MPTAYQFKVEDLNTPALISPKGIIESQTFDIAGDDLVAVAGGKKYLYVWGVARYHDVFPNIVEYVTKFCVRLDNITGNPLRAWEAKVNSVEMRFVTHGPHNCADEECDDQKAN